MGEIRNANKILIGKSEGNRPLGTPKCSWKNNIKMDINEISCEGFEWIYQAQDRDH
jgi:hypothetical protein